MGWTYWLLGITLAAEITLPVALSKQGYDDKLQTGSRAGTKRHQMNNSIKRAIAYFVLLQTVINLGSSKGRINNRLENG